jgi:hypothetical protein
MASRCLTDLHQAFFPPQELELSNALLMRTRRLP